MNFCLNIVKYKNVEADFRMQGPGDELLLKIISGQKAYKCGVERSVSSGSVRCLAMGFGNVRDYLLNSSYDHLVII
jgi:hypothetical protein